MLPVCRPDVEDERQTGPYPQTARHRSAGGFFRENLLVPQKYEDDYGFRDAAIIVLSKQLQRLRPDGPVQDRRF